MAVKRMFNTMCVNVLRAQSYDVSLTQACKSIGTITVTLHSDLSWAVTNAAGDTDAYGQASTLVGAMQAAEEAAGSEWKLVV